MLHHIKNAKPGKSKMLQCSSKTSILSRILIGKVITRARFGLCFNWCGISFEISHHRFFKNFFCMFFFLWWNILVALQVTTIRKSRPRSFIANYELRNDIMYFLRESEEAINIISSTYNIIYAISNSLWYMNKEWSYLQCLNLVVAT